MPFTRLWLAEIVEYDMRQEEPVEFRYIWDRLSLLGFKVIWDKASDENDELLMDDPHRTSNSRHLMVRNSISSTC